MFIDDLLKTTIGRCLALIALGCCALPAQQQKHRWSLEVHGGAGDIMRSTTSPALDAAYRQTLKQATEAAAKVLDQNGSSVQAVETAIRIMEDSGLFDSGKGAIYNAAGENELDAAIMDGRTLAAGSVAAVKTAKHPITLARAVMEKTPHVLIVGSGADQFLKSIGGEQVAPLYFFNEGKWQALVEQLRTAGKPVPPRPVGAPVPTASNAPRGAFFEPGKRHYGTVGVVALDREGNLAAGTSTGGSQGKMPGRVGDSPIIGAGTYASNESCAVSATGVGEYFIRLTVAREVCALVQYKGMPLQKAADFVLQTRVKSLGGVGGIIAMTPDGQSVWSFNTPGMFRARMQEGEKLHLAIYNDEP